MSSEAAKGMFPQSIARMAGTERDMLRSLTHMVAFEPDLGTDLARFQRSSVECGTRRAAGTIHHLRRFDDRGHVFFGDFGRRQA